MRTAILVIAALVPLAACAIPPEKMKQVKGAPFACVGKSSPPIEDQIVLNGEVDDPQHGNTISGIEVDLFFDSNTTIPRDNATSDPNGLFTLEEGTGNQPVNGFLRAEPANYVSTDFYPAQPFFETRDVAVELVTQQALDGVGMFIGSPTDPTKATLIVEVVDCNHDPVGGAMVTVSPVSTGGVHYLSAMLMPDETATSTDGQTGAALINDLPGDTITITATADTSDGGPSGIHMLHTVSVPARVAALVEAEIGP